MEFTIKTTKRNEIIDITEKVQSLVKGKKDGVALVFTPHATASIIINENDDPNVCDDILDFLSKFIPQGVWKHDKSGSCDRSNADAHIKSALLGPSERIIVKNGKLVLGTWQSLMFVELDGPRERKILVEISQT